MTLSRSHQRLGLFCSILLALSGCSQSSNESSSADEAQIVRSATQESTGTITRENILENERYWPDIVAMVEPWTAPDSERLIKQGYRGALIRVDELGRTRIAFGRHGNHDIPLELTDLISRANDVKAGSRYKIAPNFLAQFGTQFVHPSSEEMIPYPLLELARSNRFLCIFANPRGEGFAELARQLSSLGSSPGVQMLFFPLAMKRDETQVARDLLKAASLPTPFAYPEAAEVHARTLLGEVPTAAYALLVSSEGRLLHRMGLANEGELEALRAALASSVPKATQ